MSAGRAEVVDAAMSWWASKRPAAWAPERHRSVPTVNCTSDAEKRLGEACGAFSGL